MLAERHVQYGSKIADENAKLVTLLRALAEVGKRAATIFGDIFTQIDVINKRADNLRSAVDGLVAKSDRLNAKKAQVGNISVTQFFCVEKDASNQFDVRPVDSGFFKEATRPPALAHLYLNADPLGTGRPSASNEVLRTVRKEEASQTEQPTTRKTSAKASSDNVAKWLNLSPDSCDERRKNEMVKVDTSGMALRRLTLQRRSYAGPRPARTPMEIPEYDTVPVEIKPRATEPLTTMNAKQKKSKKSRRNTITGGISSNLHNSDSGQADSESGASGGGEPYYDYPPIRVKHSGSTPGNYFNPFASLRRTVQNSRARRIERKMTESATSTNSSESGGGVGVQAKKDNLKGFFRRSLSLRLPSKRQQQQPNLEIRKQNVEDLYDYLPYRRVPLSPISDTAQAIVQHGNRRPPTSIPISTSSQVLQLALVRRDHNSPMLGRLAAMRSREHGATETAKPDTSKAGYARVMIRKKQTAVCQPLPSKRRVSTESVESNLSLGFEKDVNTSYRQGYQLEYPTEECANELCEEIPPPKPSPRCPSEVSVADSAYSCDKDGYYTSMRRDSGLRGIPEGAPRTPTEKKGRSFSTHSSCSTVAENSSPPREKASTPLLSPIFAHFKPRVPYPPPMCDITLSDSGSEAGTHSKMIYSPFQARRTPKVSSPLVERKSPRGCCSDTIREEAFDEWLLQKFKHELAETNPESSGQIAKSLPRPRKQSSTVLGSCALEANGIGLATMPRKTVRFCE